ncbi:hypothetical protein TNIN_395561 [Trichonephila inaurata madagascariensis]|uniref:Uncharacterized protein n=1 Tax=Trichonephila inaurata madagascariensis TaxID=2747483 RepID=A0A8X6WXK8_9ARAC|nr:hypothetical protein TNIN_395561 [Trichonephila inaurata madagascariensis]
MARKKSQNTSQRKGRDNYTSPARSANQEGLLPTPTLVNSTEKIMDFSLPASPQTRRPVTPQDFAAGSSNCQELLKLAKLVKGYAISIEGCQKGINGLLQAGLTDLNHPTMLDYTRVLEDYNQRYQQAVSEFTSRPPCDTPQTVNFIPPQLTLPLKLTTHRIFLSP